MEMFTKVQFSQNYQYSKKNLKHYYHSV